mmetsp:Transcript_13965/g.34918  ORF Transcript_13965/g.34918 Transcript_13965/m.34918 type:complete len:154 (-) Transcript_13965:743-1204(-)
MHLVIRAVCTTSAAVHGASTLYAVPECITTALHANVHVVLLHAFSVHALSVVQTAPALHSMAWKHTAARCTAFLLSASSVHALFMMVLPVATSVSTAAVHPKALCATAVHSICVHTAAVHTSASRRASAMHSISMLTTAVCIAAMMRISCAVD